MVEIYKLEFTILQQEILRFLFLMAGKSFNAYNLSKYLDVSQTAVAKALPYIEKKGIIKISKDKESKRWSIELNRENKHVLNLKRAENLRVVYESRLVEFLSEKFPSSTLILFGSYSFGEDTFNSDIDIAIIGAKEKNIDLSEFNKKLKRIVSINFYKNFKEINKNLRENIFNGIILKGGIEL
ncbi:nucleotidyltransferase domain-containing protein [Candidatus Pacearchaeota archaeon]|nr:nucleotidyltransferase domain-containing protein [Candidatus Pacearchaeota archaeon]